MHVQEVQGYLLVVPLTRQKSHHPPSTLSWTRVTATHSRFTPLQWSGESGCVCVEAGWAGQEETVVGL